MKLIYRLNLSFGLLLLCILIVTAAVIYPLLFNTLIESQRKEMREQASLLMKLAEPSIPVMAAATVEATKLQPAIPAGHQMDAVLLTPTKKVLFSTIPPEQATEWVDLTKQSGNQANNHVWQGENDRYIVESLTASSENEPAKQSMTAIMATPISKIKSMQLELFWRMMIILTIGGAMTFLVCLLITRRLVTPLIKLKEELKKVETRRFSEVQLVESGGEIGEVARSVHQLAGELENYQVIQKQFFQNASHELKTPLMSIQGYAEGIKDGVFTGERADIGLDVIVNECERLKRIVTEMILLAKLESEDGIFQMRHVSVRDLITETIERIKPLLVKNGLQIETCSRNEDEELAVCADREKLMQALINIVGNAARYAKHTIRIHTSSDGKNFHIEVADDGEGIPEKLLPFLFQRFSKGKDGETGLGLAITRAIVDRCRGSITARNQPDSGASFLLRFPLETRYAK